MPDVRQFPDVERERPAPVTTAAGLLVLASVCVAVGGVATFIFVRATVLPEDFDDRRIDAFGAYWTVLVVLTGVIALSRPPSRPRYARCCAVSPRPARRRC